MKNHICPYFINGILLEKKPKMVPETLKSSILNVGWQLTAQGAL